MNPTNYITPEQAFAKESGPGKRSLAELTALARSGGSCEVCGQPVWRYAGCGMCFTCTTGESDPSDDYELMPSNLKDLAKISARELHQAAEQFARDNKANKAVGKRPDLSPLTDEEKKARSQRKNQARKRRLKARKAREKAAKQAGNTNATPSPKTPGEAP